MSKKLIVKFVDFSGKEISHFEYTPQDGKFDPQSQLPDGWVMGYGQEVPEKIDDALFKQGEIDYLVSHRQVTVSAADAVHKGEVLKGTTSKTYPNDVSPDDLNKQVNRTIKIKAENGEVIKIVKQSVVFHQSAQVDAITGEVKHLPWSENGQHVFSAYHAEPKDGYEIKPVTSEVVTPYSEDETVEIQYKPIKQFELKILYVDNAGDEISYSFGKEIKVPDGYRSLVDKEQLDSHDFVDGKAEVLVEKIK